MCYLITTIMIQLPHSTLTPLITMHRVLLRDNLSQRRKEVLSRYPLRSLRFF